MNGIGAHEVIIETPEHERELSQQDIEQIHLILGAYRARMVGLARDKRFRYIQLFKNHGQAAGASLEHSHTQLVATPIVPRRILEELEGCRQHFELKERCIYCDIIDQELAVGKRVVVETADYLAIEPFAPRFPFETWILPRNHRHDLVMASDDDLLALAVMIREILQRLRSVLGDPPYNMVVHTAPSPHPRPGLPDYWSTIEHDFHWHIELIPRITRLAGFEWGSGYTINPTPPEEAARFLREADPDGGLHADS